MTTLTLGALLCSFVALAFAIITATKSIQEKRYRWFSILCVTLSIWNLFFFFSYIFYSHFFEKLHLLTTLILAPLSAYFFLQFSEPSSEDQKPPRFLKTLTSIYIAGLFFSLGVLFLPNQFYWFKHGTNIFSVLVVSYAFVLLYQNLRKVPFGFHERKRQKYLIIGGIISVLMLISDRLSQEGIPLPALGNVFLMIYLYFIYHIITRRKILDIEDLTAKGVLLFVVAAILTFIYVVLVSWVEGPALFIFNTFIASFVILILFEPIKSLTEKMTYNVLLKGRLKTEQKLENIRNTLIETTDLRDLTDEVLLGLKDSLRITRADFFILDQEGIKFKLAHSLESDPSKIKITEVPIHHEFPKYLQRRFPFPASTHFIHREILESGNQSHKERLIQTLEMFERLNAECAIPFILEKKLLGFCSFINEKDETPYALNELNLLIPLSKQIAYALNNLEIYDRIRERDRLATLGEMSAGLAHEIKNPLGAIKGAAQYLEPSESNTTQHEFLKIIIDEVDRLNKVVTQFLNYAKPFHENWVETNLDDLIKKTIQIASANMPPQINVLYKEDSLPPLKVDPEQLNQVFLNLFLNSIQAMPKGGDLKITTKNLKNQIHIVVEDTGEGIPPENMKHLFIPFFTTKERGTGLGLPICQKIIKNHRGHIKVESELHRGTKFIISLPISI